MPAANTANRLVVSKDTINRSRESRANQRAVTSCFVFALASNPSKLYLSDRRCPIIQQIPSTALLEAMRAHGMYVASVLVVPDSSSMRLTSWDCSRVFGSNDTGVSWFKSNAEIPNEVSMSVQGTTKKTVTLEFIIEFIEAHPIVSSGRCHKYASTESIGARQFFQALSEAYNAIDGTIDAQPVQLRTGAVGVHHDLASSPVAINSTPMLQEPTIKCPSGESVHVPAIRAVHGAQLITEVPEFRYGVGKPQPASRAPKRTSCAGTAATSKKRKNSCDTKVQTKKKSRTTTKPKVEISNATLKIEASFQSTYATPVDLDEQKEASTEAAHEEASVASEDAESEYIWDEDSSVISESSRSIFGEPAQTELMAPIPLQEFLVNDDEAMPVNHAHWIEQEQTYVPLATLPSSELCFDFPGIPLDFTAMHY